MSKTRRQQRKTEIKRIYQEGRDAFLASIHRQNCPYLSICDRVHWTTGFDQEQHKANQDSNYDEKGEVIS